MLSTIQRWSLYGFAFGLCFPIGSLSIDIGTSELSFSWASVKLAHSENFLHWIIDSSPIVLGFMGFVIGINRLQLETHAENLEILVGNRTQQLQRHQLELNEFLNSAPVMMWMTDEKGKPFSFNDAWLHFTQRNLEEELSHQWTGESIHPDDRGRCITLYNKSISKKLPFDHEFRCRRDLHNDYRWLMETGMPRFSAKGQYQGHTGICIDVTDRVETEKKLLEEKERSQGTLQSIADAVITTNAKGLVQFMNIVAEDQTGRFLRDVINLPLDKIFTCIDQKTRKETKNPMYLCLKEKQIIELHNQAVLMHSSGQQASITCTVSPILDRNNVLLGVVIIITNVTDIQLYNDKLISKQKQASILEKDSS